MQMQMQTTITHEADHMEVIEGVENNNDDDATKLNEVAVGMAYTAKDVKGITVASARGHTFR
jgi:hypothetical protein